MSNESNIKRTHLGVGYIGIGKHKTKIGRKNSPAYIRWAGMLERCYSDKFHVNRPTYIDCTVDSNWHDFQVFAEWLEGQEFFSTDYDLDKDLLVPNNKIYSPYTCCLVPKEVNTVIVNSSTKKSQSVGAVYEKDRGTYLVRVRVGGKRLFFGRYKCPQDAHQAYATAKESYVKEVANKWRGRIDERVYEALMSWTVNQ